MSPSVQIVSNGRYAEVTSSNRGRSVQSKAFVVLETRVVEQLVEYKDTASDNSLIGYQRAQYEYRSGIDVRVQM